MKSLELWAQLAAIFTALLAVFGYGKYQFGLYRKREQLESYLKIEKITATGNNRGQRSILHLMAKLGMTEAEILQASFNSKSIIRRTAQNPVNNRAEALLLEYQI